MNSALRDFYAHEDKGSRPYGGQLTPSFQKHLQEAHAHVKEADCHFYHTLDLGNGRVIPGAWDMRGIEQSYLGHVQYNGLRVLECGAASGCLTFWMESEGADVVALDLPPGYPPDLVPLPGVDLVANAASGAVTAERVRNSWWYGHKARTSKAKAVYVEIYRLPEDMGRFDVSTFGSILLHLRDPFLALQEAATLTDKALVVTDMLPDIIYGDDHNSFVEFNPGDEKKNLVNWWRCSPGAITKMFKVLGFPHVDVHYFEASYHPNHMLDEPPAKRFMFTAVGQRETGILPRTAKTDEEDRTEQRLHSLIPVINADNYDDAHRNLQETHQRLKDAYRNIQETHRRLQQANAKLERIYSSFEWKITKPLRLLHRR